ncbi:hypothetical protein K2X96_02585 [Patescibacteria group bacterium]|nr:hypothetical protein [Patescibacteria group bacterium]
MEHRISDTTRFGLLLFAIICDGIQVLLGFLFFTLVFSIVAIALSFALTIFILVVYSFIFMISNVTPFTTKSIFVVFISEFTPLAGQFMPSLTWWTWRVIHTSRLEDKERAQQNARLEEAQQEMRRQQRIRRSEIVARRASLNNA